LPIKRVKNGTKTGRKGTLSVLLDLKEWEIEEVYRNQENSFAAFLARRDGYQTYRFVMFSEDLKVLDRDGEKLGALTLTIENTKGEGDEWTLRLVGRAVPF